MGIQDDAFDIQDACKTQCPDAAKNFIKWAWNLEEENDKLAAANKRFEVALSFINDCLLREIMGKDSSPETSKEHKRRLNR